MTSGSLEFTVSRSANPATDAERESILAEPGFGKYFTDHMVSIDYDGRARAGTTRASSRTARSSWTRRRSCCTTRRKCSKGSRLTAGRTGRSCRFAPRPTPPGCGRRRGGWRFPNCPTSCSSNRCVSSSPSTTPGCPRAGGEEALYLRPFVFATEPGLGVRPAKQYRYLLIASPAGAYFKGGINPVTVWVSTEYVRASPGGTGAAKFGGNYAASLLAQAEAADQRLRPGGVAGRRRAPLRRRDGRDEHLLRVRQRRVGAAGHAGAVRLAAARHHAGFVAAVGHRRRIRRRGTQDRHRRVAEEGRRRARSPRCSPAAPPRSSRRSRR